MKFAMLILLLSLLLGCTQQAKLVVQPAIIPELPNYLRQPCDNLGKLEGGDGIAITKWFVTNVPKANSCKRRYDSLLEIFDEMKKMNTS